MWSLPGGKGDALLQSISPNVYRWPDWHYTVSISPTDSITVAALYNTPKSSGVTLGPPNEGSVEMVQGFIAIHKVLSDTDLVL